MKIVAVETLQACGPFAGSEEWRKIRNQLHAAIKRVEWPVGSGSFTIYPQSGKKRGEGNGVVPIKAGLMNELEGFGWKRERPLPIADDETEQVPVAPGKVKVERRPGKLDAVRETSHGPVALEWETGNISSSHRALNKMCLGLLKGILAGGVLVVPSRELYRFLTDRIGNAAELEPYYPLWRSIPCKQGVLEVVVIEYDATSLKVPRIPKGTDGRAQV
jgi:hypothetical protein